MTDKPNLMRVARALAECDGHTQTVFMSLLGSIFPETVESGCAAVEAAGPANYVRFNTMLEMVKDAGAEVEGEALSASIRRQCGVVFRFFDSLFGEGFHKELFGTRTNLMECLDAFAEFTATVSAQREVLDARMSKYAPGRAARRAQSGR